MAIATPYYLIDEKKLLRNLKIIKRVRTASGAKSLLALKCFSAWCVFDLMREYMDGTTASSLYETHLGHEKFGKETHAYCVAYSAADFPEINRYADTVIFNSASQLKRFFPSVKSKNIGVRLNPAISYSHFDLADPARRYSRLGVIDDRELAAVAPLLSGVMIHFNCENDDVANLSANLDLLGKKYGSLLKKLSWISLGGGIFFTKEGYPLDKLCDKLKAFADTFGLQIYLEPGESSITQSTELVTTVEDIVHNEIDIAIVNASIEAHMLDLLTYRLEAKIRNAPNVSPHARPNGRGHTCMVAGRSCLAGDVFGTFRFPKRLKVGSELRIADAGGYTMVKKNWFNGVAMPSIAVKRLNGKVELVRSFDYNYFRNSLS
jgi:carboxynorspermidine decarboxylase